MPYYGFWGEEWRHTLLSLLRHNRKFQNEIPLERMSTLPHVRPSARIVLSSLQQMYLFMIKQNNPFSIMFLIVCGIYLFKKVCVECCWMSSVRLDSFCHDKKVRNISKDEYVFACVHAWVRARLSLYLSRSRSPSRSLSCSLALFLMLSFWCNYMEVIKQRSARGVLCGDTSSTLNR